MLGRILTSAVILFASFSSLAADSHDHQEAPITDMSKAYTLIEQPQTVPANGKVHVEEIFWYGCGHCFSLEDEIANWSSKLPADVAFSRIPAMFGKSWVIHAQLYYMGEVLGITDKSHRDIFNAIHINGQRLQRKSEQKEFFAAYGVSADDFDKAYDSFTVKSRLQQGDKRIRAYRISGVPAIIVNGKYLVNASSAGGQNNIFKVVDYLIAQERIK
ncbi:MAG: thiol:disulfide interchange protein DsbA [Oleispira sp.]|jgi:thiol:disulfide interchange protein DsbA